MFFRNTRQKFTAKVKKCLKSEKKSKKNEIFYIILYHKKTIFIKKGNVMMTSMIEESYARVSKNREDLPINGRLLMYFLTPPGHWRCGVVDGIFPNNLQIINNFGLEVISYDDIGCYTLDPFQIGNITSANTQNIANDKFVSKFNAILQTYLLQTGHFRNKSKKGGIPCQII